MRTFVFDTGALIALERNRYRMVSVFKTARLDGIPVIVPGVCIAEWWRGRTDFREKLLAAVAIEYSDDALVKLTGSALASTPRASCIDAMVMATAARRGGVVFTSDIHDLTRLQNFFPSVRVLSV